MRKSIMKYVIEFTRGNLRCRCEPLESRRIKYYVSVTLKVVPIISNSSFFRYEPPHWPVVILLHLLFLCLILFPCRLQYERSRQDYNPALKKLRERILNLRV